jgi:uncharacterized protein YndB with AHSA1/START domain
MDSQTEALVNAWLSSTQRHVRRVGRSKTATLIRHFDASLEKVWSACTTRNQLRQWFGSVDGDLREGETLTFDVRAPSKITSRIIRCRPFQRLTLTWSYPGRETDHIYLRLEQDGDATRVELRHRSEDKTEWWFGAGAGWELALIRLGILLRDQDPASINADQLDQKLGPLWKAAGGACK